MDGVPTIALLLDLRFFSVLSPLTIENVLSVLSRELLPDIMRRATWTSFSPAWGATRTRTFSRRRHLDYSSKATGADVSAARSTPSRRWRRPSRS